MRTAQLEFQQNIKMRVFKIDIQLDNTRGFFGNGTSELASLVASLGSLVELRSASGPTGGFRKFY